MIKFGNKAVSFNNKWVKYAGDPILIQEDMRTLSLSNNEQSLGSQIDLSYLDYRFLCIKFGATNNYIGAGDYLVNLVNSSNSRPSGYYLRWHKGRAAGRAPLGMASDAQVLDSKNMYQRTFDGGVKRFTDATTFTNGVWAEYKVIVSLDENFGLVWETTSDSYVKFNYTQIITKFNNITCHGDNSNYRSALRNLQVYKAPSWNKAIGV